MQGTPKRVTILREPTARLESLMSAFPWQREPVMESLHRFMEDPTRFENGGTHHSRNQMMRDLGLTLKETSDDVIVKNRINTLSKDLDLVLITEYFDESLILMKHVLCWETENILYFAKNQRAHRNEVAPALEGQVRLWSRADYLLYEHFNATLWDKIREFGPTFYDELKELREMLSEVHDQCVTSTTTNKNIVQKVKLKGDRKSPFCNNLLRDVSAWFHCIANRQSNNTEEC
ncbi:galactose-3-O-sulfotransferase 3-like [Saccoglossus kowalevskii]|uniref:Galactose-3-O-sulfotransferase 3-like n=1 Tax=Saccoglossus kowalevskii TaxID=10224 RepID=A0ABM0M248_SACKO|nr:PREDICTED: galactose-3-O-sulfotransferase 3-like [Saccoglossus kowalevskii]